VPWKARQLVGAVVQGQGADIPWGFSWWWAKKARQRLVFSPLAGVCAMVRPVGDTGRTFHFTSFYAVFISNFGDLLLPTNSAYSQNMARPSFAICASLAIVFLMLTGAIYVFVFYLLH
jgi:hypothetical protein